MSIRRWHKGKLIILWAWGLGIGALLFTDFLTTSVPSAPVRHAVEFVATFALLLILSMMTWVWLGDRPSVEVEDEDEVASEDE